MTNWLRTVSACLLTTAASLSHGGINITVSNPDGSPASDIVVFAVAANGEYPATQTETIEIAQKDKLFQPYITVMQREDDVQFINRDNFTHHIYSLSEGNRFSFKLRAGQSQSLQLNSPQKAFEQVAMGCNIHDWMSGFLLILDTPYFSHTDSKGQAQLPVENSGEIQLYLWHPKFNSEDHVYSRQLSFNGQQSLNWQLPAALDNSQPQANDDDFEFLDEY